MSVHTGTPTIDVEPVCEEEVLVARVAVLVSVAVLLTSACLPWQSDAGVETTSASVAVDSDDLGEGDWYPTWEEAALAEAQRLHPQLTDLEVRRVNPYGGGALGDRLVVETDGGFCRMYGGMMLEGRWRANEIGSC